MPSQLFVVPLFENCGLALAFLSYSALPRSVDGRGTAQYASSAPAQKLFITKYLIIAITFQFLWGIAQSCNVSFRDRGHPIPQYIVVIPITGTIPLPALRVKILHDAIEETKAKAKEINALPGRSSEALLKSFYTAGFQLLVRNSDCWTCGLCFIYMSLSYSFAYLESWSLSVENLVGWTWYPEFPFGYAGMTMWVLLLSSITAIPSFFRVDSLFPPGIDGLNPEAVERMFWKTTEKEALLSLMGLCTEKYE